MGFSSESVAAFIAVLGLLSIVAQVCAFNYSIFILNIFFWRIKAVCLCLKLCVFLFSPLQTVVLSLLMRSIGNKNTILLGLGFQILQLAWYGFGSEPWWVRGWGLWSCDFTEGIFEMLFWVFFFFLTSFFFVLLGWCGLQVL